MKSLQSCGCYYFGLHSFLGRIRMKGSIAAVSAVATLLFAGAANAGNTLGINYFEIAEPTTNGDFGPCCSSPPATSEGDLTGTSLLGGLPVAGAGNTIASLSGSNQILWWSNGVDGIVQTGTGSISLPYSSNMFAPNSTGKDDTNFFETAAIWGFVHGTGSDVQLTVASDDDTLVYLNGAFVGGNLGVHGTETTTIDLGDISGTDALNIFYADRAQVAANLATSITGATTGVPEPATWVMMGLGFAGLGFAGYRARKTVRLAV
jgi:hypothetical protein